jgi:uncharacterized protein (DUF924 family)
MHGEHPELQALSVAKFTELVGEAEATLRFAKAHASLVDRFGRFPARNEILGRASTPEEEALLAAGEGRF